MEMFEKTSTWRKTLGVQGDQSIDRLRTDYFCLRANMIGLLDEVKHDFPNLTDHSIRHSDGLWKITDLIIGDSYPINPLEGFILGCAFLVHDSVLSYKAFGGKDILRDTDEWKDRYSVIKDTDDDTEEGKHKIDFIVIRSLHALKCADILFREFDGVDGEKHYLLPDDEMRNHFGQLIGDIAASHHWELDRISSLQSQVNGLSSLSMEWIVNPRKLACILRCADAAAIDSGRAPDYLFRLLQLNGVSKDHWVAQNRLGIALDTNDNTRLMYTSTHDFSEQDFAAWNVAYDAVNVVDDELNKCQYLLTEQEQFHVKGVAGAKSRKALASYIKTRGWTPCDVSVHISDVAHLIMTLGGKELYGRNDVQLIVLRELIQNACDAIRARRILEKDDKLGNINVKVDRCGEDVMLRVTDDGVGMSLDTIANSLLNFGSSFWHDDSVYVEFPGLKTAGFESVGQFGIGFFSVFMIAKSVEIETRKYTDALKDAHLVKFPSGLTLAPIFANHTSSSTLYSTSISLKLTETFNDWPIKYEVRRSRMNQSNFIVPFSAMLSTLVAGLNVDVYYKEFSKKELLIHRRIDAEDFDKKAWLRDLAFADYQNDIDLNKYIDENSQRLRFIYDKHQRMVGLAAIGTKFQVSDDYLGGATVGGLLTQFHSRDSEYWIGVLEKTPNGAKRSGGDFCADDDILRSWVQQQIESFDQTFLQDVKNRFRAQLVMQYFKMDPRSIAVAFCILSEMEPNKFSVVMLDSLITILAQGRKLIFIDSDFASKTENEGHGDSYINAFQVATLLQPDEILYAPIMNSGFLTYKFVNGVPVNDFGFIDCLYRQATEMGYHMTYSYKNNYAKNIFGSSERALVISVERMTK